MKVNRSPATSFWTLRRVRLSRFFRATGSPSKDSFCFHPYETGREKRGVPSEKAPSSLFISLSSFLGWKISSCQEAFRKERFHTANEYMHMHSHNLILSHIRNFNQSTCSFCSHLSAIQSAVGFCLCQITSSICQPN